MRNLEKLSIILLLLGAACASPAPPLPVDTTSNDRVTSIAGSDFLSEDLGKNCRAIKAEMAANTDSINKNTKIIEDNRVRNQTAGYFGSMFIVPLAATESNDAEKEQISKLQTRQDVLRKLAAYKKCSLPD